MAAGDVNGATRAAAPRSKAWPEGQLRAALAEAGPAVRRYLFGLCRDWDRAEDLAQETLLKAWRGRAGFDGRAEVRTWVFRIARNHWLDQLRRRRGRPRVDTMGEEGTYATDGPSPQAAVQRGELAEAIERAMAALPDPQREALALRESEGLTFAQIGEVLGIPPATAKSRVRYALLKLADELAPFGPELDR
ncbi:MAG TPA: RNA polymerase sigma factor [Phycisphaerae bacterium]|nr:RNA polymerase sigma factor [Phycisphaerae bacterium]